MVFFLFCWALLITIYTPIKTAQSYEAVVQRLQAISDTADQKQQATRGSVLPPIPLKDLTPNFLIGMWQRLTTKAVAYDTDRCTKLAALATHLEQISCDMAGIYVIQQKLLEPPQYIHIIAGYDPLQKHIYVHCAQSSITSNDLHTLWHMNEPAQVCYIAFATLSPTTDPQDEGNVVAHHDPSPLKKHTLLIRNCFNKPDFFKPFENFFTNPQAIRARIASGQ